MPHKSLTHKSYFNLSQFGFTKFGVLLIGLFILSCLVFAKSVGNHASADSPKIQSGVSGNCLDVRGNNEGPNSVVDLYKCNNTNAQVWQVEVGSIIHDNKCLSVKNGSTKSGSLITLGNCVNDPSQIWLKDDKGFYNPNSGLCLSASEANTNAQIYLSSCNKLNQNYETWNYTSQGRVSDDFTCKGSKGAQVACNAEKEFENWNSGTISHSELLYKYTDGSTYEEWCADYISYVYKESGHPFTHGESNGWDENLANNIQNQGFTKHMANSGYIPKTGDLAYFNYSGGHVEIVFSGGKNPTFIYGNSGNIDPTTGNGEMEANTIVNDGIEGQLVYYLSPY